MLQAIEEPFLEAVKMCLAQKFTPYIQSLYKKTIHFILETLIAGFKYEQHQRENNVYRINTRVALQEAAGHVIPPLFAPKCPSSHNK